MKKSLLNYEARKAHTTAMGLTLENAQLESPLFNEMFEPMKNKIKHLEKDVNKIADQILEKYLLKP